MEYPPVNRSFDEQEQIDFLTDFIISKTIEKYNSETPAYVEDYIDEHAITHYQICGTCRDELRDRLYGQRRRALLHKTERRRRELYAFEAHSTSAENFRAVVNDYYRAEFPPRQNRNSA